MNRKQLWLATVVTGAPLALAFAIVSSLEGPTAVEELPSLKNEIRTSLLKWPFSFGKSHSSSMAAIRKSPESITDQTPTPASVFKTESEAVEARVESPDDKSRALDAMAASLKARQIQTLGAIAANSSRPLRERILAVDLLSRNQSPSAYRTLEATALRLKHLDRPLWSKHPEAHPAGMTETTLAMWIVDSLARQPDPTLARASLQRLRGHEQELVSVRWYLDRVSDAANRGKLRDFYDHQDQILKHVAGNKY